MKVILNTTTNYKGCTLKLGDEIDIPLNVAQRWINRGIAHDVKGGVRPVVIVKKPVVEIVKKLPKVIEIDLIEPIPERFTSFEDEPKVSKPIWKSKKKKSKEKITDEDNS